MSASQIGYRLDDSIWIIIIIEILPEKCPFHQPATFNPLALLSTEVMRFAVSLYSLFALLWCDNVATANNEGQPVLVVVAPFRPGSSTTKKASALKNHYPSSKIPLSDTLVVRGGAPLSPPTQNGLPKAWAGAVVLAAIEKAVKMGLSAANIQYPAQLGACILLFSVMCLTDLVHPKTAAFLADALTPAAALLSKWFPIFFIPGLVMLPLSPSIGGTVDVRFSVVNV
jgi:hypothetical protein